jgi:Protein involved in catabolism of external DNA
MLSYRHAFHAGNHADVLKHLVLVQLTRYLARKDKAFWYVDTHAGARVVCLGFGARGQAWRAP